MEGGSCNFGKMQMKSNLPCLAPYMYNLLFHL